VTILLALLRRYWLHMLVLGTAVLVLGISHRWAWVHGADAVRLECAEKREKLIEAALKDMQDLQAERDAAQKRADELAKLPPKVIERVRQSPSQCSLSPDVADELRKQVAAVNAAIREHNRNVSRDSGTSGR
jgi:hypothetical protein